MKKKKILDNLFLFIPILILIIISLCNMYKVGLVDNMYKSYFFKQALWFLIGSIVMGIIILIKPKLLFKYSKYFYFINVLLLILVLFFGKTINGSRAWFNLYFFSFQPSELMKFTLSLFLADTLSKMHKKRKFADLKLILTAFFITLVPSLFVFLEPDTGAIVIYFLIMLGAIIVYGVNKKWYIVMIALLIVFFSVFFYLYYFKQDLLIKLIGTSFFYRIDRILTFVNNDSFQLDRALTAIGSSSFLSTGNSVYIPEAPTDFIIALTISNFGLIGFILVILSFFILDIYFLVKIFRLKNLSFKMFYATFFIMFLFQQIENIGMNLGLLPIIGIPLPFLSYGGTNIIVYFIFLGILINIKRNHAVKNI